MPSYKRSTHWVMGRFNLRDQPRNSEVPVQHLTSSRKVKIAPLPENRRLDEITAGSVLAVRPHNARSRG